MTKICKKVAQHFHCTVLKVFDRVKSVALWSAKIRKVAKDHKGYGSAASNKRHISKQKKVPCLNIRKYSIMP
jgi:hypothetical protein